MPNSREIVESSLLVTSRAWSNSPFAIIGCSVVHIFWFLLVTRVSVM